MTKVIGFWKVNETYGFLSQWYISNFTEDDILFNNCEKYMMYKKALLFDPDYSNTILHENNPLKIKKMGRLIKNFNQEIWDNNKFKIIYKANYFKFTQNKELSKKLLDTKPFILAEASPLDRIYGIGMGPNNPNVQFIDKWRGQNLLGKALMDVRDIISNSI
jgi:ribA/ribD-fused uncharacterized protein